MAAPAFGSVGTLLAGASTTTAAVPVPAGVAANDIIIVTLYLEASKTITPPAGFTQVGGAPIATSIQWNHTYWKRATGNDTGTYTFSWSGATFREAIAVRVTGAVLTGDPIDVFNRAQRSTNGSTTPAVSVTTTGPERLLFFQASSFLTGTWTQPTGFTERHDDGGELTISTREQANAGSTGSLTATHTGNSQQTAVLLAIKPLGIVAQNLTDTGVGTEAISTAATLNPVTDTGVGTDALSVVQLTLRALDDTAVGTDQITVAEFIAKPVADTATGTDTVTVARTNLVPLTDTATGSDPIAIQRQTNLTDTAAGTETLTLTQRRTLTDTGVGTDEITIVDIPFTQVLPLAEGVTYDLVIVARIQQINGPPTFLELDPIEWSSLTYADTVGEPQELAATCLLASVPETIRQRLVDMANNPFELWLYREGKIVFAGPIVTWRASGENLTLNARGLLIYLRLMQVHTDQKFTGVDRHIIVKTLIDQWQNLDSGHFGIDTSAISASGGAIDAEYPRDELHNVGVRVAEMGGFDAEVDPVNRRLRLWSPQIGVDRSVGEDAIIIDQSAITSAEVTASVAIGDLASEAYLTSKPQGADVPLFALASNPDLRARYGRCATSASFTDIETQPALNERAASILATRGEALVIPGPDIRVTLDADLPSYAAGDTISCSVQPLLGMSGAFRIRKRQVQVSSNQNNVGTETVNLEFA